MLMSSWLRRLGNTKRRPSSGRQKPRAGFFQSGSDQYLLASWIEALEDRTVMSAISESTTMAEFQVSLAAPSPQAVTVKYAVTGGTAAGSGVDFTLPNGTLTFKANETLKTVRFPIVNDTRDEADETIQITLSAPTGATLGASSVINVTILDDDSPPSVSFQTTTSSGSESATAPRLTVLLSAASGQ